MDYEERLNKMICSYGNFTHKITTDKGEVGVHIFPGSQSVEIFDWNTVSNKEAEVLIKMSFEAWDDFYEIYRRFRQTSVYLASKGRGD